MRSRSLGRRALRTAVLFALGSLAACSSRPVSRATTASTTANTTSTTAGTTTGPGGGLTFTPIQQFTPDEVAFGPLDLWSHYVAWTGGLHNAEANRLLVRDLSTGKTKLLATSPNAGFGLDYVKGSRDTVVYTLLGQELTDSNRSSPWTITAVDLITMKRVEVAKSKTAEDESYQPLPVIEWPYVVWAQASGPKLKILSYDLSKNTLRTVAAGVDLSNLTVNSGLVVWDDAPSGPKRNVFVAPVDHSGPPRQLTTSGQVELPTAANGHVVWQEPANSQPQSLWEADLQGDANVRKVVDGSTEANEVAGTDFVAWLGAGAHDLLVGRGAPASEVPLATNHESGALSIALRLAASGDRLAWGLSTPDFNHATIYVTKVSAEP